MIYSIKFLLKNNNFINVHKNCNFNNFRDIGQNIFLDFEVSFHPFDIDDC